MIVLALVILPLWRNEMGLIIRSARFAITPCEIARAVFALGIFALEPPTAKGTFRLTISSFFFTTIAFLPATHSSQFGARTIGVSVTFLQVLHDQPEKKQRTEGNAENGRLFPHAFSKKDVKNQISQFSSIR